MKEDLIEVLFQSYRETPVGFDEELESCKLLDFVNNDDIFTAEGILLDLRRNIALENFKAGFKYATELLTK